MKRKNAGTWINLQDAYVLEKADSKAGNWQAIGYSAPGKGNSESYESDNFSYHSGSTSGATAHWYASNKKALNDCPAAAAAATSQWELTATASGTNVQYVPNGDARCLNLTPAFAGLSRATAN